MTIERIETLLSVDCDECNETYEYLFLIRLNEESDDPYSIVLCMECLIKFNKFLQNFIDDYVEERRYQPHVRTEYLYDIITHKIVGDDE